SPRAAGVSAQALPEPRCHKGEGGRNRARKGAKETGAGEGKVTEGPGKTTGSQRGQTKKAQEGAGRQEGRRRDRETRVPGRQEGGQDFGTDPAVPRRGGG